MTFLSVYPSTSTMLTPVAFSSPYPDAAISASLSTTDATREANIDTLISCVESDPRSEHEVMMSPTLDPRDMALVATSYSRSSSLLSPSTSTLTDDSLGTAGAGSAGSLTPMDFRAAVVKTAPPRPTRPTFTLVREIPTELPFDVVALSRAPQIPVADNEFDIAEATRWASNFPEPAQRRVMLDLVKKVERVDFDTFAANLEETTVKCANILQNQDYVVLVERNKSNQWVAELAMKTLQKKKCAAPSCVLALGDDRSQGFKDFLMREMSLPVAERYLPRHVVLFDDGTFSGQQMSKFVDGVLRAYHDCRITSPRVIVVCPYATSVGAQRILNVGKAFGSAEKLFFLSKQRIPLLSELFRSKEDRVILGKTFWPGEKSAQTIEERYIDTPLSSRRWPLEENFRAGPFSRGALYFAHKVPNGRSFVTAIEHGEIYDTRARICNGTIDYLRRPIFTPHSRDDRYEMIPSTKPPYKR